MAEACNGGTAVMIATAPVPSFIAIVRAELYHAKRNGRAGVNMPMTTGTRKNIHVFSKLLGCTRPGGITDKQEQEYFFQDTFDYNDLPGKCAGITLCKDTVAGTTKSYLLPLRKKRNIPL